MSDIANRALEWAKGDPDPETSSRLIQSVEANDQSELEAAMGATLQFGTAGIRGAVGPGSNRMNRAMVIRTTAGLARFLLDHEGEEEGALVVVGYDARPTSRTFAEDTTGVLVAAGFKVFYFPDVAPTPLVAFAGKALGAAASVVVTASHNPPADNGYKVYASNGAQIVAPWDSGISSAIESVGPASEIPRIEACFTGGSEHASAIDSDMLDRYWEEVNETRPSPRTSDLVVVYTPIHGVGGAALAKIFEQAGHTGLVAVPEQAEPDGTFPTVDFPNPEEAGALDLALALANERGADLLIANDPDADRLAAAVPHAGEWRMLSGNELGAILADYVLRNWEQDQRAIVANSIVSSPILSRIADRYGASYTATLTGFKWIVNAALAMEADGEGSFAFGYEEALGYTVGRTVRDKDGISAALVFCDLAAELAAEGMTVLDRLYQIWGEVGLWVSAQESIVRSGVEGAKRIAEAVVRLGDGPPSNVSGVQISQIVDYRTGAESRPFWLGNQALIELELGDSGRILVRPSGTEPKLKVYVDLAGEVGSDPTESHSELLGEAKEIAGELAEWLEV